MEQLYYEKVNKALDSLTLRADKVSKFIGFSESPSTLQRDKGRLYIGFEDGLGNYKALPFSLPALEIVFEGEGSTFKELIEAIKVKYEKRALYYYPKEEESESDKMYKETIPEGKKETIKERLEKLFLYREFRHKEDENKSIKITLINSSLRFGFHYLKGLGTTMKVKEFLEDYILTEEEKRLLIEAIIEKDKGIEEELKEKHLVKTSISKKSEEFLDGENLQVLRYLFLNHIFDGILWDSMVVDIKQEGGEYLFEIGRSDKTGSETYNLTTFRRKFTPWFTNIHTHTLDKIIDGDGILKEAVKIATLEEVYSPPTANGVETFADIYKGKDNSGQVITATPVSSPMYKQMYERHIIKHYPMDYKEYFKEVDLTKQALNLPDNIYDNYNRKILLLI